VPTLRKTRVPSAALSPSGAGFANSITSYRSIVGVSSGVEGVAPRLGLLGIPNPGLVRRHQAAGSAFCLLVERFVQGMKVPLGVEGQQRRV